jgi:hypothetical protein
MPVPPSLLAALPLFIRRSPPLPSRQAGFPCNPAYPSARIMPMHRDGLPECSFGAGKHDTFLKGIKTDEKGQKAGKRNAHRYLNFF